MIPDQQLLDFDHDRLADGRVDVASLLAEHGDLYRNHLAMAIWITGWRERLQDRRRDAASTNATGEFNGEDYALREIAAHLRQGDFLPTGVFLRDLEEGT